MKSQALDTSVGFVYDPTDYLLAAQYDKEVSRSICVCCTVCVDITRIMYLPCVCPLLRCTCRNEVIFSMQ